MTTTVTKESLAARIADLESGARSLKEDYTLAVYKMLLATMEAEPVAYSLIFRNMEGVLNSTINTNTVFATREKAEAYGKGGNYEKRRDGGLEWVPNTALDPIVAPLYLHARPAPVVPGWIPVGDRLPENKPGSYEYLVFETLNNRVNHDYWNVPDKGDDAFTPFWNYYGEHVTHWMPLPVFAQK